MFDSENQDVTINTSFDRKERLFNISVAMHSLDMLTAKQADTHLKGLIAQALKTAVMEKFGSIQNIVDEVIHSPEMRLEFENILKEEFRKRAAEHVKDMFG